MFTARIRFLSAAFSFTGVLVLSTSVATARAATPVGGAVKVFDTAGSNGVSSVVIVGAIGDHGTVTAIDKTGAADPDGNYAKVVLEKGTLEVDMTALVSANDKGAFPINKVSCTSEGTTTAPASVFDGTGSYKGIRGTIELTETNAWILPRYPNGAAKGQCEHDNAFYFSSITGTGNISFS